MRAFIVNLENRPGTLADLGDALGERGINIIGAAGTTWDDRGAIAMITNDDSGARTVLEDREIEYRDVDIVSANLEDRPGVLGATARRLADRGINIEVIMPTGVVGGRVILALGVDDPAGAREALGDLAVSAPQAI